MLQTSCDIFFLFEAVKYNFELKINQRISQTQLCEIKLDINHIIFGFERCCSF